MFSLKKEFNKVKYLDGFKEYLAYIKNKEIKGFNFGYNTDTCVLNNQLSNALYVGGMGSGSVVSLSYTITDFYYRNKDNTTLFIIDMLKGASEFRHLFPSNNVFPVLNPEINVINNILSLIEKELMTRQNEFAFLNIKNQEEYNVINKNKLSYVILVIEQFHGLMSMLKKEENKEILKKLEYILKQGSRAGICILAGSQSGHEELIPLNILNHLIPFAFKTSSAESHYLIGSNLANEIEETQRAFCYTKNSIPLQFPRLSSSFNFPNEFFNLEKSRYLSMSDAEIKKSIVAIQFNEETPLILVEEIKNKLSLLIKDYKNNTGVTRKQLSQILDIDESNLSKIIHGGDKNLVRFSIDSLIKYLELLAPSSIQIREYLHHLK